MIRRLALAGLAAACAAAPVAAQRTTPDASTRPETVRVAPDSSFRAGWLRNWLLGPHWRHLWTMPIEVEVLDLERTAGGLTPTEIGGGQQTRSLRFRGGDGREYVFRPLEKDPSNLLPIELRGTVAEDVVRDQFSASHPAGALIADPILDAAGVLNTDPRLVVLADEAALDTFRTAFAGKLGTFEVRPAEAEDEDSTFAGASKIISSDKLFERVQESPANRVDAPTFLSARLVDLYIGDWDRHRDQWRWARFGDEKPALWRAIPRDRDQAFADYDGLLLSAARTRAPQLVRFGPEYAGMVGLTWNGRELDRRFLAGLERPVWDSTARAVQAAITDSVIDAAIARLPAEFAAASGADMREALRRRRDELPEAAHRFYRLLAEEAEVHATDKADRAEVTRLDDHVTDVAVFRGDDSEPYFRRRFDDRETDEVRLFLYGGDDAVAVRGDGGSGITLRVIGGPGQDTVADSSRGRTKVYDSAEPGEVETSGRVSADLRPYTPFQPSRPRELPPRDWGRRWMALYWLSVGPDLGLLIGGGPELTNYGFRKLPYGSRQRLRAAYATGPQSYRVEYEGLFLRESSRTRLELRARASGIDVMRFNGFGNEIAAPGPTELYRVTSDRFSLDPALGLAVGRRGWLSVGPTAVFTITDRRLDRFIGTAPVYGDGDFGQVGARATFGFDTRDVPANPHRGVHFVAGGSLFPAIWDVEETFGELHGEVATYLTAAALPFDPTLAVRVGGKRVWGLYPYPEAAYIGDAGTVRLGRENRYAGDASVYGGAELRLALTRVFVVVPGQLGITGFGDVGRVYLDGEESDVWHGAWGGGVWASFLGRAQTVSLTVATSDVRTGVYLGAGFAF